MKTFTTQGIADGKAVEVISVDHKKRIYFVTKGDKTISFVDDITRLINGDNLDDLNITGVFNSHQPVFTEDDLAEEVERFVELNEL